MSWFDCILLITMNLVFLTLIFRLYSYILGWFYCVIFWGPLHFKMLLGSLFLSPEVMVCYLSTGYAAWLHVLCINTSGVLFSKASKIYPLDLISFIIEYFCMLVLIDEEWWNGNKAVFWDILRKGWEASQSIY